MHFDHFFADYGILPSAYFKKSAITNPMEMFWSEDLCALLRLCGEGEKTIGQCASDFDRFLSLCRVFPLLEGHPTRTWIISVLQKHFGLQEPPTAANANEVWKFLCKSLLKDPLPPQTLVSGAWLCDSLIVPDYLPTNVTPVLNAKLLLDTNAKIAAAWSAEIATTVAHFASRGCTKVVLHLDKDFGFVRPSLYHVDRALSVGKKDRQTTNLLLCQLARELCAAAQKNALMAVLVCDKNAYDASELLQYCEESVGLPPLCWCICEAREALPLLEFSAKPHRSEIFAALAHKSTMTQQELTDVLNGWRVRYPIGRLGFITACDLRQTPSAQKYICDMLENSKIKI